MHTPDLCCTALRCYATPRFGRWQTRGTSPGIEYLEPCPALSAMPLLQCAAPQHACSLGQSTKVPWGGRGTWHSCTNPSAGHIRSPAQLRQQAKYGLHIPYRVLSFKSSQVSVISSAPAKPIELARRGSRFGLARYPHPNLGLPVPSSSHR